MLECSRILQACKYRYTQYQGAGSKEKNKGTKGTRGTKGTKKVRIVKQASQAKTGKTVRGKATPDECQARQDKTV